MNMILLVPKIIQNFKNQFPEVRHNAYKYFNYDNRVINERVERFDYQRPYQGPDDFSNSDYDQLVKYAKTLINPVLAKYSGKVACEDALSLAIRSYERGRFDGKVNAGRFEVLLKAMAPQIAIAIPVMAKKEKKEKKKKPVVVKPHILKQLGKTVKDIPMRQRVVKRVRQTGIPMIVRDKGKNIIE